MNNYYYRSLKTQYYSVWYTHKNVHETVGSRLLLLLLHFLVVLKYLVATLQIQ